MRTHVESYVASWRSPHPWQFGAIRLALGGHGNGIVPCNSEIEIMATRRVARRVASQKVDCLEAVLNAWCLQNDICHECSNYNDLVVKKTRESYGYRFQCMLKWSYNFSAPGLDQISHEEHQQDGVLPSPPQKGQPPQPRNMDDGGDKRKFLLVMRGINGGGRGRKMKGETQIEQDLLELQQKVKQLELTNNSLKKLKKLLATEVEAMKKHKTEHEQVIDKLYTEGQYHREWSEVL